MTTNVSFNTWSPSRPGVEVRSLAGRPGEDETAYEVFVGSIGYESRASHIAKVLGSRAGKLFVTPFPDHHAHAFYRNARFFEAAAATQLDPSLYAKELAIAVGERFELLRALDPGRTHLRICVDISSMTRLRLADTMRALYGDSGVPVDVDWLYAPARYTRRLEHVGPVQVNDAIPGFEGWGDPILPLHGVVGVGLEGDLVLGVLDDLEPFDTWIFEPTGFAAEYDERVRRQNETLLRSTPPTHQFRYDVRNPFTSFLKVSAVVDELRTNGRVLLLPLGPKIFALICLLLGYSDDRNTTVWRLSALNQGAPVDRVASGEIIGLRGLSLG
jgi:hypothetical protein